MIGFINLQLISNKMDNPELGNSSLKEKLKKELLEGMCMCAEDIQLLYLNGPECTAIYFDGCPEAFKPGTNDKFIFNKIIDQVIDEALEIYKLGATNPEIMAVNLMSIFYYPNYGNWKNLDKTKIKLVDNTLK